LGKCGNEIHRRLTIGEMAAENEEEPLVYLKNRGQLLLHIEKRLERGHRSGVQGHCRTYTVLHRPRKKQGRIGFKSLFLSSRIRKGNKEVNGVIYLPL